MPSSPLSSFHSRFPSEAACVAHLETVRWQGKPSCPRCGHQKAYKIASRGNWKCAGCRRTFTVRHGTIFEDSKLPLRTWFEAIFLLTTARAGVSSVELSEKLGITQKSAWFVLQRIQYAVSHADFGKPLSGEVEMDDAEMTYRKPGSPFARGGTVVALAERGGPAVLKVVEKLNIPTAKDLLRTHVAKDAVLMTDGWASYDSAAAELRMTHKTVNHGAYEYAKPDGTHTNTVEGLFGNFGRRLKGVHIAVSAKHLQKYCNMYGHRYNHRKEAPMERFEAWFGYFVTRLTWEALTGRKRV